MTEPLDVQIRKISRRLNQIAAQDVPRATSSALNKVAKKIRTRVVRGVAKSEKLPNKVINKKVFIRRSTVRTQRAVMTVYRGDVSVIRLIRSATIQRRMGTGTNRQGITVRGRKFPGAFINTTRKGAVHAFKRKGAARNPIGVVKIPINKAVDRVAPKVAERVHRSDFLTETRRELTFRLQRRLGSI